MDAICPSKAYIPGQRATGGGGGMSFSAKKGPERAMSSEEDLPFAPAISAMYFRSQRYASGVEGPGPPGRAHDHRTCLVQWCALGRVWLPLEPQELVRPTWLTSFEHEEISFAHQLAVVLEHSRQPACVMRQNG